MELPYTLKLAKPLKHGDAEINELVFTREPVAGDLRGMRLSELDKADNMYTVVGRLTGHPPSVMQGMGMHDLVECSGFVESFFPRGPRTGIGSAE
ncbi:MAG: phage tail assembly protein [Proteobacteria bacterium]|nr:phage tail assembly protein [Pseudomonadota bacterium]